MTALVLMFIGLWLLVVAVVLFVLGHRRGSRWTERFAWLLLYAAAVLFAASVFTGRQG